MERLNQRILQLSPRHRRALSWFADHAGTSQPWPAPLDDGTLLVTKAKGIYKPAWTDYALSVRQTLHGPYPDLEPINRTDGTWLYAYYQESQDPAARDAEFTNRGLVACWKDLVPVGVLRQDKLKPNVRYRVLGLALVSNWDGGYFFLEGFSSQGLARGRGPQGQLEGLLARNRAELERASAFEPASIQEGRERTIATILRRRGRAAFREALLDAYGGKCPITACAVIEALADC